MDLWIKTPSNDANRNCVDCKEYGAKHRSLYTPLAVLKMKDLGTKVETLTSECKILVGHRTSGLPILRHYVVHDDALGTAVQVGIHPFQRSPRQSYAPV